MARQRIKKGLLFSTNPNKAKRIPEEYKKFFIGERFEKNMNKHS